MPIETSGRRPLKTRDWPFFKKLAAWLARSGATPNTISFMSIVFGCGAGALLAATAHVGGWAVRGCWLGAAVCVQLRLIANLLDGMVAVEGRKGGPVGDLWNEAPDRVSDAAIFIGAGFAAGSCTCLGFSATIVALFVAYVRALGASVGVGQVFLGPQAKQQRMAVMTFACVLSAVFPWDAWGIVGGPLFSIIKIALVIVIVGGVITAWRRLSRIATLLREKAR
jgi:phosphatidylglycerophosphate synthase